MWIVTPTKQDSGGKKRMSISLDPDVIPLGEQLASEDRRSLSNMLEVLILNEHKRRQTTPTPAEKAEVAA